MERRLHVRLVLSVASQMQREGCGLEAHRYYDYIPVMGRMQSTEESSCTCAKQG